MGSWLYCKMVRRGLNSAALQFLTAPFHKATGDFKCGKGAPFGRDGGRNRIWMENFYQLISAELVPPGCPRTLLEAWKSTTERARLIKLSWRRDKKGRFIFFLISLWNCGRATKWWVLTHEHSTCAVICPKGFSRAALCFLSSGRHLHNLTTPSGSAMSLHFFSFINVHLNGHK